MEYLMTYGWAILIIAVVLGALYSLGVFNGLTSGPRAPPGSCHVFRPNGPLSTLYINLEGVCNGQLPQYVASFGGSSQYVKIANFPAISSVSIAAWINPGSLGSGAGSDVVSELCSTQNGYYMQLDTSGTIHIGYQCLANSGLTATSGITTGKWIFVVGEMNGNVASIYVNGVQKNSGTVSASATNTKQELDVACCSDGYFNGQIANVQIYNTSLTQTQVQALYLEGIGGAPQELSYLVGWWPLNGNATDYSGDYNNGQIQSNVGFISSWTTGYTAP